MRPVCVVQEEHGDILIADSGEAFMDKGGLFAEGLIVTKIYRTAFCIDRGDEVWIASFEDTGVMDPTMTARTPRGAQEYRVNEALEHGRKALQQTVQAGLYRGDHGEQRLRRSGTQ